MQLAFDGLNEAHGEVTVTAGGGGGTVDVKVKLSGIRRSLHLGDDIGCELHWACHDEGRGWYAPAVQPQGSRAVDAVASRIECKFETLFAFPQPDSPKSIAFVVLVHGGGQEHWLKAAGGKDFVVPVEQLAQAAPVPAPVVACGLGDATVRVAERPTEWPELAEATAGPPKAAAGARQRRTRAPVVESGAADMEQGLGRVSWHVVRAGEAAAVFVEAAVAMPEDAEAWLHFGCQACAGAEWEPPVEVLEGTVPFGDGKATRALLEGQARAVLKFPRAAPGAIAFVVYVSAKGSDQWLKTSGGADFGIALREGGSTEAAGVEAVARSFCDAETKHSHWSHFQRLCLVKDVCSRPGPLSASEAAWMACDLRLAQAKALEWYRQNGYQPKDMAHCQEALGGVMAVAVEAAANPVARALLRLAVQACPRGNASGGDAIRHGILNMMRTHGIKEGHRPGIECKFFEQWHQKLHTNSAPDDIAICEGYLAFLSSGNPDDLFRVVYERAGLTREDMGRMAQCGFQDHTKSGAQGLNVNPVHLPQLYNDMQSYLGLLKHVHGGTGLLDLCEACKGQYPDHGTECMAFDVYQRRDDPMVLSTIVEMRRRLATCLWKRDLLMLDVALESQLRLVAERTDVAGMGRDDLLNLLAVLLSDLRLSRRDPSLDQGVELCTRLHEGDGGGLERWSSDWCKLMLAAYDRVAVVCASLADAVAEELQACCERLRAAGDRPGAVFRPDPKALATFGEESARCLSERLVSQCLRALLPQLRRSAGLGRWEVVSQGLGEVVGRVAAMKALPLEIAPEQRPCIAVTETLTGWEDIPAGIVAVLLPAAHAVDVLSHVAIRARNQKVVLACCDDQTALEELRSMAGDRLKVTIEPGGQVAWSQPTADEGTAAAGGGQTTLPKIKVLKPPAPPAPVLPLSLFAEHNKCLGGKSLHLAELKPSNGEYRVPASATVPFGMFEEALRDPANEGFEEELGELLREERWPQARALVADELELPASLETAVSEELKRAGAPLPQGAPWQRALRSVWASKWTERAVSSRRQVGVPEEALSLAVLAQPLADAAYAFVIHTRSPMAGAREDEALVELVVGLGESLVSNSPGRALSASVGPSGAPIAVHSFPSKPGGVFAPEGGTHIFRSDSNGEDLEGFAGAGLYDSITVAECRHRPVAYAREPLLFDAAFREKLLRRLFDLGRAVEANFGGKAQDIEGCVDAEGGLMVLQARPQV